MDMAGVVLDSYDGWVKSWQQRELAGSVFSRWRCSEYYGNGDWIVDSMLVVKWVGRVNVAADLDF